MVEYRVPIQRYWQFIFVPGTATIIFGFLILSLPVRAISNPGFQFYPEFVGYLVCFPIFLMYSMWFTFGYEKVLINDQQMVLLKSNVLFTIQKTFALSDIKSIETSEKIYTSDKWIDIQRERIIEKQRAFPFWIRMGQLKLITKKGKRTFFNGLSGEEIQIMKNKIEKELEKRKLKNESDFRS